LAKPNYSFEKRQRDLAKKSKQEEKRQRKLASKATDDEGGPAATADPPETSASTEGGPTKIPV
jgi:hypothetical protein